MAKSKQRKGHKEKSAKRTEKIATEKKLQNKRMNDYIKQIMESQKLQQELENSQSNDLEISPVTDADLDGVIDVSFLPSEKDLEITKD